MLDHTPKPAKMLICFTGRHKGEMLVSAAKAAGARGGTLTFGRTLADNRWLRALALADIQEDIIFIVMGKEATAVVGGVKAVAAATPRKLGGMALVIEVPELFVRLEKAAASTKEETRETRSESMQSGYKLIIAIVNAGFGEDVMALARKAGARGGTIISARGTGTEDDVKFFGITLVPEKEMLLVVAEQDKSSAMIEAMQSLPELASPGGGIIFAINVEEFILLGT
ncbi:MAG: P-II family nitrogen regulator [Planctomycetota bacterium]|jgi:nitrogen regulatory protein PII|nr:P-II family nitrogen regulator [Planctomycetota bacterium]